MSFTSGQYYIRLAKRRAGSECAKTVRKVSAKRVVRRFGEHVCIPPVGLIFECAKWPEHLSVIIVIFATEGGENLGGKGGNRERQGKGSREMWKDIMSNDGTFQYVRTNTVSFRNSVITYGVRNLEPWLQLVFPEPNFFYLLRLYLLSDILLPRLNFVTCTNKIKWEFQFQVYEKYLFIGTHILVMYHSTNLLCKLRYSLRILSWKYKVQTLLISEAYIYCSHTVHMFERWKRSQCNGVFSILPAPHVTQGKESVRKQESANVFACAKLPSTVGDNCSRRGVVVVIFLGRLGQREEGRWVKERVLRVLNGLLGLARVTHR